MKTEIRIKSMVDERERIASVSVLLYGEGRKEVVFEGEKRIVELSPSGTREDYFITNARLWRGESSPELYSLTLTGEMTISFGLRNIGLSQTRGFFLNEEPYPLSYSNTRICEREEDLEECDRKGIIAALLFPFEGEISEKEYMYFSSHPSLCFIGYRDIPSSIDGQALEEKNRKLYALDETRATIASFSSIPEERALKAFDTVLLPEKGGEISTEAIVFLQRGKGFEFRA